jgi:hypothetical protein
VAMNLDLFYPSFIDICVLQPRGLHSMEDKVKVRKSKRKMSLLIFVWDKNLRNNENYTAFSSTYVGWLLEIINFY